MTHYKQFRDKLEWDRSNKNSDRMYHPGFVVSNAFPDVVSTLVKSYNNTL
jgi:hypothetical protein